MENIELKPGDIIRTGEEYLVIDIVDEVIWYRKIIDGYAVLPGYRIPAANVKPEDYELVYRLLELEAE